MFFCVVMNVIEWFYLVISISWMYYISCILCFEGQQAIC